MKKTDLMDVAWSLRNKLHAEGSKLRAEGNKLHAEANKLHAEANKLYAEGDKLYAEGDLAWAHSIIITHGPKTPTKWNNNNCTIKGKTYTYKPNNQPRTPQETALQNSIQL